jgi:hypothetical protein
MPYEPRVPDLQRPDFGRRRPKRTSPTRAEAGRYKRKPEHSIAFVGIAATLICYRRLTK